MAIKKTKTNSLLYIAAVGASAGGLEALQKLLLHLPLNIENIAFVIAQHLSPTYKSMLAETLSNNTGLNVIEVKNAVTVKEKNIYITPPNHGIIIRNGKLQLSKPKRTAAARPSIDNLFISLAKDKQTKAIGIILSGTGSDGAKGIKAIKDAGGITFVQDPVSAKDNGMPLSSIETGQVDYILAPEKIGAQLKEIIETNGEILLKKKIVTKNNGFDNIIEVLSKSTGTDFTNYKQNTLFRRINKRLAHLKINTANQYLDYIEKNPGELDELFHTVLIGFTVFFRDAGVFKPLEKILQSVINSKPIHDPLRIWIVGCATGEEAYSVAITLAMLQKEKRILHPVQIIATDINEQSLNVARKGIYSKKAVQNVPPDILKNYFTSQNGNYEINKTIRSMVLFSRHDITNNPPFLKLDLIVCRNLLIYFNSKLQNHVFPVFHSALQPNGYLWLGKSESIGQYTNLFSLVNRTAKIYQRKAATQMPKARYAPFKFNEKFIATPKPEKTITEMAKETIFQAFEWPYVVVNDNMEIQEIHGDVSNLLGLKAGQMNANLIKLAHKDLKIELRSLVNKCIIEKKEIKGPAKKIDMAGKPHFIKITAQPLVFSERPDEYYLVIFEDIKNSKAEVPPTFIPSTKNDARRILALEQELETVKEDLQTFVERLENTNAELQSTNEELQAANEELKISNEELETANEELQSANEEINIAYTELKAANEALEIHDAALRKSRANVNALLSNTMQAFVLLDADFQVLAFNSVAHKTFKNIFGKRIGVGDSFTHLISPDLSLYFKDEIDQALMGKIVITEKEIKTAKGQSYGFIVSCTPVLDEYKKVQALSFSLLDITELKKTKYELLKSQELVSSVFHTADIGIAVINEKGKYVKTNDGYNKLFGYESNELEGKHYTVSIPPGLKKESYEKFIELFSGKKVDEERLAIKKNGKIFNVFRTANLLRNADGHKYLVITARDISETKKYQNLLQNTERITHLAGWEMDIATEKITCTEELYNIIEMNETSFNKLTLEKKLDIVRDSDSRPLIGKALADAIHKGKPFDLELPITTSTYKKKWVRITCTPERFKSKTTRLRGIVHDITLKKQAELQLERLSLVASKTNNAVFITNASGKTVWVNESFEKMTGFKRKEVLGKMPGEILQGKETDKATISRMSKALKKQLPISEVIKNYKKDGTPFWINMDITPVFKDIILVNFIGVGIDITELIEAKESQKIKDSLQQQQKLFNAIAKNFPDGIIGVLDKNFHYVFAGGAEIKKLGLTQEQLIGNKIFDRLSEKSNAEAAPYLTRALSGENVIFEAEMRGKTYTVNAVPLRTGNNGEVQILVVMNNITNRKKAEEEVWEALTKQKELNELKSKFVSIASHEFRTPLSTILSSVFLISKYSQAHDENKAQKHIDRITTSVNVLTDILNDFLSLGKIEEGKVQNNITDFNVVDFCKTLIDEIQLTIGKGQTIIYHHEGVSKNISLDKTHLRNVLINLLSNAAKYSPEVSKVWLTSTRKEGQIQFTVKDKGMGIPHKDQPHLFETFFRANNAVNIQGTGMGLHIVKRFLDIMGGTIHFSSNLNKGSSFTVQFTLKEK
ncbi:MAG TPA: PAS domain S-box protein [Hanamia sp.]